jgi:uncharacterized protein YciI
VARYLLLYDVVEDYVERRVPFRPEHLRLVREAQQRGELWMAGALAEPVDGAVLAFTVEDRAIVERFAENDPYVQNGLVTRRRVRRWDVVVGGD